MSFCKRCGATKEQGLEFCVKCGEVEIAADFWEWECMECGAPMRPDREYCVRCGKAYGFLENEDIPSGTKNTIFEMIREGVNDNKHPFKIASDLFHTFGELNFDWQRIAVTECAIIKGDRYVLRLLEHQEIRKKNETKVLGTSAVDACPWCKENIHGKVFFVISEDEAPLNVLNHPMWDTHLWRGKRNFNRYFSKYKVRRSLNDEIEILPRPQEEIAKACFGGAHPNCRCWFTPYFDGMKIGADGYVIP